MSILSEDDLEQAALQWLSALGWQTAHGPDISPPDARTPGTERHTYRQVCLSHRLEAAIRRLNPHIPPPTQREALRQVLSPNTPGLVAANRQFHRWLVEGVPVEYQRDGCVPCCAWRVMTGSGSTPSPRSVCCLVKSSGTAG
jgi:type I restriction enzyme R subunit